VADGDVRVPDRFWSERKIATVLVLIVFVCVFPIATRNTVSVLGLPTYLAVVIPTDSFLILFTLLLASSVEVRRFSVSPSGPSFRRLWRDVTVPWVAVQPDFLTSSKRMYPLVYRAAGAKSSVRVMLTAHQARALASHPSAPTWNCPADKASLWGLDQSPPLPG